MAYTELCPAGSLPQVCLDDCFVDRLFHIFVPQTVDHGIQHGSHCGVKHSHHLPLLHTLFSGPPETDGEESPVNSGDSGQVGPTRGECRLLPSAERMRPGRCDEGVEMRTTEPGYVKSNPAIAVMVYSLTWTPPQDKRRLSTIVVVGFNGSTEVQAICPRSADQANRIRRCMAQR